MNDCQERILLILKDECEEIRLAKDILKSPLGLAKDIIKCLFDEKFEELKDSIDEIKGFAAGVNRAQKLKNYSLASYYSYMFAFHQYFHSSYRARQGKVLEKMIQEILRNYGNCDNIPNKNYEMLAILSDIFNNQKISKLDLDAMGVSFVRNKSILIQLRSRDDTGGTTAKGSLVDLLRELIRVSNTPKMDILYLVCIWDPRDSQQKNSTVKKMFSSLKDLISIDENKFIEIVHSSVELREKIKLRMFYGTDEIAQALYEWIETQNDSVLVAIYEIINMVEDWDDLWLSYAIASIELHNIHISGQSNIRLIKNKCDKFKINFNFNSYNELTDNINAFSYKLLDSWTENSIPFSTPSDIVQYIRDLLYMKACYERIS